MLGNRGKSRRGPQRAHILPPQPKAWPFRGCVSPRIRRLLTSTTLIGELCGWLDRGSRVRPSRGSSRLETAVSRSELEND